MSNFNIKTFCENPKNPLPKASPDQFYNFVWVDEKVNNEENMKYRKSFEYLEYKGFKIFDNFDGYMSFLNQNENKNNIFVFTGGPLTD